ncbi:MAG: DUF2199 domain-containing protein [Bacteroidota bacterium]
MFSFFKKAKRFAEPLDKKVFTTIYVMKENSPITLITHELDGDWQFVGDEPAGDYKKTCMVVCLEHIIDYDKSVLDIADMPKGYQATRKTRKHKWEVVKIEYSDEEIAEMGFICSQCGELHKEIPMAYNAEAPYAYYGLSPNEADKRCAKDEEVCVIDKADFYVKGTLHIPVDGRENFCWTVWAKISKEDFERSEEVWDDENRILEQPYPGTLATQLHVYPDSLGLAVKVRTQKPGTRPEIEVMEADHPLFFEQESGIDMERVTSFARQLLYAH